MALVIHSYTVVGHMNRFSRVHRWWAQTGKQSTLFMCYTRKKVSKREFFAFEAASTAHLLRESSYDMVYSRCAMIPHGEK